MNTHKSRRKPIPRIPSSKSSSLPELEIEKITKPTYFHQSLSYYTLSLSDSDQNPKPKVQDHLQNQNSCLIAEELPDLSQNLKNIKSLFNTSTVRLKNISSQIVEEIPAALVNSDSPISSKCNSILNISHNLTEKDSDTKTQYLSSSSSFYTRDLAVSSDLFKLTEKQLDSSLSQIVDVINTTEIEKVGTSLEMGSFRSIQSLGSDIDLSPSFSVWNDTDLESDIEILNQKGTVNYDHVEDFEMIKSHLQETMVVIGKCLDKIQGPIDPSNNKLYNLLLHLDAKLNNYFSRKFSVEQFQ